MEPERLQPQGPEREPRPMQRPERPERAEPETERPQMQRPEPPPPAPMRPPARTPTIDSGRGQAAGGQKPPAVLTPGGRGAGGGIIDDGSKTPSDGAKKPPSSGMLLKVLALVVLAMMGWFYFGGSSSSPVPAAAEESAPNYSKNKNADPRVPAMFSGRDIDAALTQQVRDAALRGDPLPGVRNPSRAFIEAAKRGEVTFYRVRAYDTCAEDGDVVTLRLPAGGEVGPIPLTTAGTTVSVPVVTGTPAQVSVVAVKDGVGGVTLGVQTSGGVWFSQVMPVGGSETMPLAIH